MSDIQYPKGYRKQDDIKCCHNCAQKDIAYTVDGKEYLICTIFNDPVDQTGICDSFEF